MIRDAWGEVRAGAGRKTSMRVPRACRAALLGLICVGVFACASSGGGGRYYTIRTGDNLYRIGLEHGVDADEIARENGIHDVTDIRVGQVIWVPAAKPGASKRKPASSSAQASTRKPGSSSTEAKRAARDEAKRNSSLAFHWPLDKATLTSRFGRRRGRPHEGIDLGARRGTAIHAAESGKVIHSGWLGDYGRVVIVKHAGHYSTVYAHANELFVRKGQFVDQGDRIAEVGSTGKSTGPHLHFELRKREVAQDPMLYLP